MQSAAAVHSAGQLARAKEVAAHEERLRRAGLSDGARHAGFTNNEYIGVCDITQGPHAIKPALPDHLLSGIPDRATLEAALLWQVLEANKLHWVGMWPPAVQADDGEPAMLGSEAELELVRALPAPTGEQIAELAKLGG